MSFKFSSKIWKKAVSISLVLVFAMSGSMTAFADRYDIGDSSLSIRVDDDNWHYVNDVRDGDNDVVITGDTRTNTITVDAGATVTLDDVNIFLSNDIGENAPLTITDNDNTGKAATVIMEGGSYVGLEWGGNNPDDTPAVLVEEGASLDLQVEGNCLIEGYLDNIGEKSTPGIQLEDGATLTISDHDGFGELDVRGAIGTAKGSDANVTININEKDDLCLIVDAFSEAGDSSPAAIGNGVDSTGSATVNINGGYIYATVYSGDDDAIGNGTGATGETVVNFNGDPYVMAKNSVGLQIVSVEDDEGTIIYKINDQEAFNEAFDDAYEVASNEYLAEVHEQELTFIRLLRSKGINVSDSGSFPSYDDYLSFMDLVENDEEVKKAYADLTAFWNQSAKNVQTKAVQHAIKALDEADYEMVYHSSVQEEPVKETSKERLITCGEFAYYFVSVAGEYLPEIAKLKGDTTEEIFQHFKEYVEKNKIFDASALTDETYLTAGQIAATFCQAAGIELSDGKLDAALDKLNEKGILLGYRVDGNVPVTAAKNAVKQFVNEFVANR